MRETAGHTPRLAAAGRCPIRQAGRIPRCKYPWWAKFPDSGVAYSPRVSSYLF